MKAGDIYETLDRLVTRLKDEGIEYALIGALALVAHGYRRFTEDVALLMTREGLNIFNDRFVGLGYIPAFGGATNAFRDVKTGVKIEVVTTGEYPGDGKPKPVAFPDPLDARTERDGIWLITLEKLIELKLASGLSAPHRLKDISDIQELIIRLKLTKDFARKLDNSVQTEFLRLWKNSQSAPPEELERQS